MLIPKTKVEASFYNFTPPHPPLYYDASDTSGSTLASVNAGNSDGLCVGLKGVNGAFFDELTKTAKQQNVSLNNCDGVGAKDDYQHRHQTLLAKAQAATGKVSQQTYPVTDPSVLSYCDANQVGQASGYFDGVCFVDVFDVNLCPNGNAKNAAMLYIAPPYGPNYKTDAAFLAAIQATAVNIIRTVAGYNAFASGNKMPVIETLRNTLFSSGYYNTHKLDPNDIASAIFAGFESELQANPPAGLVELQFPVGGSAADPFFKAVQTLLTAQPGPNVHGPANVRANGRAVPMMMMPGPKIDPRGANADDDNDAIAVDDVNRVVDNARRATFRRDANPPQRAGRIRRALNSLFGRRPVQPANPNHIYDVLPVPQLGEPVYGQTSLGNEPVYGQTSLGNEPPYGQLSLAVGEGENSIELRDITNDQRSRENPGAQEAPPAQLEQVAKAQNKVDTRNKSAERLGAVTGTILRLLGAGSFLWAFLAGAGRKWAVGPFAFHAVNIPQDACSTDTIVSVNVLGACGNPQFLATPGLSLLDGSGNQVASIVNGDGTWTVASDQTVQLARSITSLPTPAASASYHLIGQGDPLDVSLAQTITISFPAGKTSTTTTLSVSPSFVVSQATDQMVMVSATVTAAGGSVLPAGSQVSFTLTYPGGSQSATADLMGGSASGSVTIPANLPAGTCQAVASYSGSCALAASSSTATTITITSTIPTTTTIMAPAAPALSSTFNVSVTVSADPSYALKPSAGTATVTLTDASGKAVAASAAAPVTAGMAVASLIAPSAAGSYQITAAYSGDSSTGFAASTAKAVSLTISKQASTSTVLGMPSPSGLSASASAQNVNVSATVASSSGGTTPVSGTVTFTLTLGTTVIQTSPAQSLSLTQGSYDASATLSVTVAVPGSYTLTASYSGDANFDPSNDLLTFPVTAATTTRLSPVANIVFSSSGQLVMVSAKVTPATASGQVTFSVTDSSNKTIGTPLTLPVNSTGTATGSILVPGGTAAGSYTLTAAFTGAGFTSSNDHQSLIINSSAAPVITSNPDSVAVLPGTTVTFTAAATNSTAVQWQASTGGATLPPIAGATNTTLTLPAVTASMNGFLYHAIFSNSMFSQITTDATLTVANVVFVTTNPVPMGNWGGVYGSDGQVIAGIASNPPAYAAVIAVGQGSEFTYNTDSKDQAALQDGATASTRIASTFTPSSGSSFEFVVNVTDTNPHQIALYLDDHDTPSNTKSLTITFSDPNDPTNTAISTQSFANFSNGIYAVWNYIGSVKITVQSNTVAAPVLSGLFFDPPATQPDFNLSATAVTSVANGNAGATTVAITAFGGFNSPVTLAATNWPQGVSAQFTSPITGSQTFFVSTAGIAAGTYSLTLTGTSGALTASTTFTLKVANGVMMMAHHVLAAANLTRGRTGGFDVLSKAVSTRDVDPKSVVLLGLQDLALDSPAGSAVLRKDGKLMQVPGEGVWMVDDNGLILFNADDDLDGPPTPVVFALSDVEGMRSNPALLVVDESLSQMNDLVVALRGQSDDDFWKSFNHHIVEEPFPGEDPMPTLEMDTVLLIVTALAQAVNGIVRSPGAEPLPQAKFDVEYKKWDGQDPSDLIDLSKKLVDQAFPSGAGPLIMRFWRLTLMARMIVRYGS